MTTAPVVYHGALGPAFPAIIDNRLAGLLYWAPAGPVHLEEPDGPLAVSDPGWCIALPGLTGHEQVRDAPALEIVNDRYDASAIGAAMEAATDQWLAAGAPLEASFTFPLRTSRPRLAAAPQGSPARDLTRRAPTDQ